MTPDANPTPSEVLQRLREGLDSKKFRLTSVARMAGLPATTLDHMRKQGWGERIEEQLERVEAIKGALDTLEATPPPESPASSVEPKARSAGTPAPSREGAQVASPGTLTAGSVRP